MLKTLEHIELMDMFEKEFNGTYRMDREDKALWIKGHIYQDGNLNALFLAYRRGYSFGKVIGREETA